MGKSFLICQARTAAANKPAIQVEASGTGATVAKLASGAEFRTANAVSKSLELDGRPSCGIGIS
ncbi:MAG: hypothetical protein DME70_05735 [Verrucomicrobia bacterium]|nr:MAG: hypothetical protein DME70_05735 [Verrucomicrobiota bacterium]